MTSALVAFGANLGPAEMTYRLVADQLRLTPGIHSVVPSPLYQTWPVGIKNQQLGHPFINGAFLLNTDKRPVDLFDDLDRIQVDLGGEHRSHWSPRSIDLDLICVEGEVVETDRLILPHPRMHFRWFVLRPAVDLAPELLHPVIHLPLSDLLTRVEMPNPHFLWFGEDRKTYQAARQRIGSRLSGSSVDCQGARPPVAFQRLGNQVVGGWIGPRPDATWLLVAEHQEKIESDLGPRVESIPAIDLQPQPGKSSLERLDDFLDSLTVGQPWEAHIE
jgi:2-amino-4-hydroxy-6-hydroxymethyldihydropteridine diphosphokinase